MSESGEEEGIGHRKVGMSGGREGLGDRGSHSSTWETLDVTTLFVSFPVPINVSVSMSECMGVWAYGYIGAESKLQKRTGGEENALVSHMLLQHILKIRTAPLAPPTVAITPPIIRRITRVLPTSAHSPLPYQTTLF